MDKNGSGSFEDFVKALEESGVEVKNYESGVSEAPELTDERKIEMSNASATVELSNIEMERMLDALRPFMQRSDVIGYAAARNARILTDNLTEYAERKNEAVIEYGDKVFNEDGKFTGEYSIGPASEKYAEFEGALIEIASLKHDVCLYRIPFSKAIDNLSGEELFSIDFMFYDE